MLKKKKADDAVSALVIRLRCITVKIAASGENQPIIYLHPVGTFIIDKDGRKPSMYT